MVPKVASAKLPVKCGAQLRFSRPVGHVRTQMGQDGTQLYHNHHLPRNCLVSLMIALINLLGVLCQVLVLWQTPMMIHDGISCLSCVRNLGELRPGTVEPPQHATPYRVLQRRPRAAAAASESHPLSSLGFELVDAFPRLVTVTADQPAISSSQVGQMSTTISGSEPSRPVGTSRT